MKLVKFSRDWADEFEVEGFDVLPDEEWQEFVDFVYKNPEKIVSYYFGTNESWEDEMLLDFSYSYHATDISDEETETLTKLFGDRRGGINYGIFPHPGAFVVN